MSWAFDSSYADTSREVAERCIEIVKDAASVTAESNQIKELIIEEIKKEFSL